MRLRLYLTVAVVLVGGGAVVVQAGSSTSTVVRVSPSVSVEDQPLSIRITGLAPDERATLSVSSTDAKGISWHSGAKFRADRRGEVNVDRDRALGGSYAGAWRMGLIATMRPSGKDPYGAYFWSLSHPLRFALTVSASGRTLARASFVRRWSSRPLTEEAEMLAGAGFVGDFFAPTGAERRPAVLVFGGSEGGLKTSLLAGRLAADGYPALALAYFDEPGLPQTLTNVPLEYFQHALQWLAEQPQVDPTRVAVLGISRGSEAALLLGVHYPTLVHGVIALVPSNVVNCGIAGANRPDLGCTGPAWTFDGKPVPYTRQFNDPHPSDDPAAVIPVEQINGPVLVACGGQDVTWHSCEYSHAIVDRLEAHHVKPPHYLYAYPQAGHSLGIALPYEPGTLQQDIWVPQDEQAREQLWPHIIHFVRALG